MRRFLHPVLLLALMLNPFGLTGALAQPDDDVHRGISGGAGISGRALFIGNRCVRCHTIGRGRFVGPDLEGVGKRYARDEIVQWITDPRGIYDARGAMPLNEGYPPMPPIGVGAGAAGMIADFLLAFEPGRATRARSGTIEGVVVNRTDGIAAARHPVTLKAYLGDVEKGTFETKTDSRGRFAFSGLEWAASYALAVEFKGGMYETMKMVFEPDEVTKNIDLPVYDPTTDPSALGITNAHVLITMQGERVAVTEVMVIKNPENRMYVGEEPSEGEPVRTFEFDLPTGSVHLTFYEGLAQQTVVRTPGGFADTTPISPGVRRVIFNYMLTREAAKEIVHEVLYPTRALSVLVSEAVDGATVQGLEQKDTVTIEGTSYMMWEGTELSRGKRVVIRLAFPSSAEDYLHWIIIAVLVLAVGGVVAFSLLRSGGAGGAKDPAEGPRTVSGAPEGEKQRLIDEIAELDTRFEAGDIARRDYDELRELKKKRVMEIVLKLESKGD